MGGSDTSACRADIQRLGEFYETCTHRVRSPKKDGYLDADARSLPLLSCRDQVWCLKELTRHCVPFSTVELVRHEHLKCQSPKVKRTFNSLIYNSLIKYKANRHACAEPTKIRKCPGTYRNCANGTYLPLTVL